MLRQTGDYDQIFNDYWSIVDHNDVTDNLLSFQLWLSSLNIFIYSFIDVTYVTVSTEIQIFFQSRYHLVGRTTYYAI